MTLGDRIKACREALKMTQEELGTLCNTTKQTIFKYETGIVTNIPLDRLELLAEKLEVTPGYLTGWGGEAPALSEKLSELSEPFGKLNDDGQDKVIGYAADLVSTGRYARVEPEQPVLLKMPRAKRRRDGFVELRIYDQPAAAGLGNYIDAPSYSVEQYPAPLAPEGAEFGVRISGDSMEPDIPNGCTVFVRPTPAVEPGEIGIFVVDGQAYCKKLIADRRERRTKLRSLNPKYPDIVVEDETLMRTLGRVLGHYTVQN
ncbi:MAG: helix-turn-helix domain-containing protein [Oscillospiraceae bacterium]|nr:helix-turn-helix domain-containing protein [Oscillospiraceae bacterium]